MLRLVCCLFFATTFDSNGDTLLMGRSVSFQNNPSTLSFGPKIPEPMHPPQMALSDKVHRALFAETTLQEIEIASKITRSYEKELITLLELAKKMIIIVIFGRKESIETGDPLSESVENEAHAILPDDDPGFLSYSYSGPTDFMIVSLPIEGGKSQNDPNGPNGPNDPNSPSDPNGPNGPNGPVGPVGPNKKKPKLQLTINLPQKEEIHHRRLTCQLSQDAQFVRLWLRNDLHLENHIPKKLLLSKQFTFNTVAESGHRLTVIAETPDHRKYVIKVTDTGYSDFQSSYGNDPALITFKQAVFDVLAFQQFQNFFNEHFPQYEEDTIFPTTHVAIVSVDDYLKNLPDELKTSSNPMLSILRESLRVNNDSELLMFVVIQQFIPSLRKLNEDDFKKHEDLIEELTKLITDIKEETGQNLLINSNGQIALIDVELDQIDWRAREKMGELKHDKDAMLEALRNFDDLECIDLDEKSYTKLRNSLGQSGSSDSGIYSYKSFSELSEVTNEDHDIGDEDYDFSDEDVFEP